MLLYMSILNYTSLNFKVQAVLYLRHLVRPTRDHALQQLGFRPWIVEHLALEGSIETLLDKSMDSVTSVPSSGY